jgi:short-subunit dehydrogenase
VTDFQLQGTVAVVTGAGRGIGRAIAVALAAEGATVVAVGRDGEALQSLVDQVGGSVVVCDVRLPGSADDVATAALAAHGRIDVVVANAGVGWAGDLVAMSAQDITSLVETNVAAPLQLARACLPSMLERGGGRLLFVSSIAGALGVPGEAVYSATKAALEMFADVLREELRGSGVEVAVLRPGVVRTDFFAGRGVPYDRRFPRPVRPERVAKAAVRTIRSGSRATVRPRWLWLPIRLRSVAPRVYRALERRFG